MTTMADMAFNRAKTLATGGKLQLADETYMETARMAYGTHLGAYTKAVAAARSLTDGIVTQALQVGRGGWECSVGRAKHILHLSTPRHP